jgi:hypothetical protein
LEFSQELVKIYAAAYNFDFRVNFGMSGRYKQPVQNGRASTHKSRAGYFSGKHQNFPNPPIFLESANIFQTHLFFWKAPIFSKPAYFSGKRQYFPNPPIFLKSAKIFQIRLFFEKREKFVNLLDFAAANICVYFQYLFLHSYY